MTAGPTSLDERTVHRPAGARQAFHRHDDWRLVVFLAGETLEADVGAQGEFLRGTFVVRPPFYVHSDTTLGKRGSAYVRLALSRHAAQKHFARCGWRAMRGKIDLQHADLARRVEASAGGDEILQCMDGAAYASAPDSAPLDRLAKEMSGAPRRLALAAGELGLRPYQLTRKFVQAFGTTPREYARQARLQRAMAMLAENRDTIAGIATTAGFHDQSHLCRELKRETGLTPRAFAHALA